jgi:threonine dehydrogenase-like Zn-dependent dehydrogenase
MFRCFAFSVWRRSLFWSRPRRGPNWRVGAGADVVETDPERIREVVLANTEGRGVDVAIESVGKTDLYALAFELIRPGGHLAAFGIAGADERLPVPLLETVLREKSIKGSVAGMGEDMHDALTLLRHGRFRLEPFVAKSYPLADIQRAFEELPKIRPR